jgi:tricarballylate dehydrogenase
MTSDCKNILVVGHGAAGLAASVAAAELACDRGLAVDVTLVDKAPEQEAGGNSRWSPSYIRMEAPDRLAPSFEDDVQQASGGRADPAYVRMLAANAVETMGWLQTHGVEFTTPIYYLSVGPPRIQPVGGGRGLVEALAKAAKRAGVAIRYETALTRLRAEDGRVVGADVTAGGSAGAVDADAIILACGGFQGNVAMMRQHFGPLAASLKLISPGTRYDGGDGLRLAVDIGAETAGDFDGMHIEPVDPRSRNSAPVVLVYPYGIVVDQNGERFLDEGAGLVHETWERLAREIHFRRPNSIAYAILDSQMFDIEGYERAIRSEVRPYQSETLEGLAALIGIPARTLRATVDGYNAAASGDPARFDATCCDGLAAGGGLKPPKSNWARAIVTPPYLAYPLIGAIAYTFGGVATNEKAEVLGARGPIRGLYAAGEITGHFHRTAPNAVAMLRALVFGRIAGRQAIEYLGVS